VKETAMKTRITALDRLPTARATLKALESKIHAANPVILFSGEGESLLLLWWLKQHDIKADGVFVVTNYGRFWWLPKVARARWEVIAGRDFGMLHVLTVPKPEDDPCCLVRFIHNFHLVLGEFSYEPPCVIQEWLFKRRVTDVFMGVRKDDLFRHLKDYCSENEIRYYANQAQEKIREGYPISTLHDEETGRPVHIWWPIFDLDAGTKDQLLDQLQEVVLGEKGLRCD